MKAKTTTKIKISAAERKAALQTLDTIKRLFKGGKRWIQNEEKQLDEDSGEYGYCLIGAAREADGAGEELAVLLLAALLKTEVVELDYEYTSDTPLMVDDKLNEDYTESIITAYNDAHNRKYQDISRAIDKAKKLLTKNEIVL